MQHRGACGCDQDTGDGAGILLQLPDPFFRAAAAKLGVELPAAGDYGVAFCFLPTDAEKAKACRVALERVAAEEGQVILGWRPVPVASDTIGWLARTSEPQMEQLLLGRGAKTPPDAFERKLYVIRRRAERWAAGAGPSFGLTTGAGPADGRGPASTGFAVTSCSARTIVYKGMLKPDQLEAYFPDLAHPGMESALAPRPQPVQHEHVAAVGAGPPVQRAGAQRRDQHPPRERPLAERPRRPHGGRGRSATTSRRCCRSTSKG
jgi:glutamate synthase (NADPH/NADH) large chain/glutamate synthase (ferredoxin)